MKKVYLFLLALVCTMASWASAPTTDWIDYTQTFHSGTWTNAAGGGNAISGYLRKVVSTTPEGYFPVTIEVTTAENYLGYATLSESGSQTDPKYKRPWFKAGRAFSISVPQGVKIVAYEMQTKTSNGNSGSAFKYTAADGTMATSPNQNGTLQKITVENLDVNSFMIDMSEYTASNGVLLFNLRLKLQYERVNVTINAHEGDNSETAFSGTVSVFTGENINIAEALPASVLVRYTDKFVDVTTEGQVIDVSYTDAIPFATSFDGLDNKWVSFFTKQGRMHVYDAASQASNGKYPSIDKATFTNLTDNKFWGFICTNPLVSSVVKIVNKGAGETKGTLYMTTNNAERDSNDPLLLAAERGSNITDEWVIEKGQTDQTTGTQYYLIKANGYSKYINNFQGAGFMTTWKDGSGDLGSNIKFTSELDTYETLKERALNAPKGAVHSLNDFARQAVTNNSDNTVAGYKKVIDDINDVDTDAGFIQFKDGGYYYLQNYTPAGTGKKTFVLGSDNGTAARTYEVTSGAATAANAMDYTNLNAIWKIAEDVDAPPYEAGSDNIGVSKTIGRYVTHVNSANKLYEVTRSAISSIPLNATGSSFYFVNLGAGQHFIKNEQYNGSGQQAKAMPIKCDESGNLSRDGHGNAHYKNTRETWYGIPVTSIKVTISDAGYATLHLPFGVNLPTGTDLKAYVVSAVSATEATMTEVNCIPANKGVILMGTANTPYTLPINDAAAWDESVTNLLEGSNMHKTLSAPAYVLSQPAGKEVGLYKAAMTAGSWLNNDNKAYLPASVVPNEAKGLSFVFDTETGIKGIDAAKAANTIYDLSGRRVKAATKGIFIINGKKVIK